MEQEYEKETIFLLSLEFRRQTHFAKKRTFEINFPRKGIARPQSQCPHSCVCERFIYSHDIDLPILIQENMWAGYINRLPTHECGNWN
jgi:hypothetical protein